MTDRPTDPNAAGLPALRQAFTTPLPASSAPAAAIVDRLAAAGHSALLAGGCVRDLLLGSEPSDFDVATSATPDQVGALFRPTRRVGAHFGVVLVRSLGRWVEVATFRTDGSYVDGRHPLGVTFSDPQHDAARRDFTINGMFLDPRAQEIIDYVGGRADLAARAIRAIGDPAARFAEDHLRLLRAVRFAARLDFGLESATAAAISTYADRLERVAPERVREELEKLLARPGRARGLALLAETGLIHHLWRGADWRVEQTCAGVDRLGRLPAEASFETALAGCLLDRSKAQIDAIARSLACSNAQRETTLWLVRHHRDLIDPDGLSLAQLKRLVAHPDFQHLRMLTEAAPQSQTDADQRAARLDARIAAIGAEGAQPPPLVTGADLIARGVPAGPIYKQVLEEAYTLQLNEAFRTRERALAWLDGRLAEERQ